MIRVALSPLLHDIMGGLPLHTTGRYAADYAIYLKDEELPGGIIFRESYRPLVVKCPLDAWLFLRSLEKSGVNEFSEHREEMRLRLKEYIIEHDPDACLDELL